MSKPEGFRDDNFDTIKMFDENIPNNQSNQYIANKLDSEDEPIPLIEQIICDESMSMKLLKNEKP